MGDGGKQATKIRRHPPRGALWLYALFFVVLTLRPAWYWTRYLLQALSRGATSWSVFAREAVTEVGPPVLGIALMAFLWKTLGFPLSQPREESPEASPGDEPSAHDEPPLWKSFESRARLDRSAEPGDVSRGLWLFALGFLCLGAHRAWLWVQYMWLALNNGALTAREFAGTALTEAPSFLLAIGLIASLWKTLGPPSISSSLSRAKLPKLPKLRGDIELPTWQGSKVRARRWIDRLATYRVGLWSVMFVLIAGSACWLLLSVACAMQDSGWPMTEAGDLEIIVAGFIPISVSLCLALVLWALVGPPYNRTPD